MSKKRILSSSKRVVDDFLIIMNDTLTSVGKSQHWLSRATGISQSMLSDYFSGKSIPSLKNAIIIVEVLGNEVRKKQKSNQK